MLLNEIQTINQEIDNLNDKISNLKNQKICLQN